jgi:hypothetical protein
MSVYGYSIAKEKVGFNIHFTSAIANSWTGTQFDACFPIDLRGHLEVSDFQKEYNVYLSFRSAPSADVEIATNSLYAVHLDIGNNNINADAYSRIKVPHYILNVGQITNAGNTANTYNLVCSWQDNAPIRVKTLYGVDNIRVNIINIATQSTFNPAVNANNNYHFILRFEEV